MQAIPGRYRIAGAPRPPTAAWDASVSSGVASMFEPALRLELGYFYSEFLGIHDNYVRHLEFMEREVLPRAETGPATFYGENGKLLPEFVVQMRLLDEFGEGMRKASRTASLLEAWLRTGVRPDAL